MSRRFKERSFKPSEESEYLHRSDFSKVLIHKRLQNVGLNFASDHDEDELVSKGITQGLFHNIHTCIKYFSHAHVSKCTWKTCCTNCEIHVHRSCARISSFMWTCLLRLSYCSRVTKETLRSRPVQSHFEDCAVWIKNVKYFLHVENLLNKSVQKVKNTFYLWVFSQKNNIPILGSSFRPYSLQNILFLLVKKLTDFFFHWSLQRKNIWNIFVQQMICARSFYILYAQNIPTCTLKHVIW